MQDKDWIRFQRSDILTRHYIPLQIKCVPLQTALETIQKHDGGTAVADGYKSMYQRLVAERCALIDRTVDLEHQNKTLKAKVESLQSINKVPVWNFFTQCIELHIRLNTSKAVPIYGCWLGFMLEK